MAQLQRGIAPDLLVSQVANTMPYLFEEAVDGTDLGRFPPAQVLRSERATPTDPELLDHFGYFRLCMSSHYLSCGTPVPTDVDNQIRQKLWPRQLPLETALQMAELVLASRKWDFTQVSNRNITGASGTDWEKEVLSGHLGEWFTLSSGAYCALRKYEAPEARAKAKDLLDAIADEVHRHSEIFGSLWRAGEGVASLKASAYIAHNFGDLDRVMDMWDLSVADPLRLQFYKLGVSPFDTKGDLRYMGRLWTAGELYKSTIDGSSMALENHRHYALRKPRSLRERPEYLIPTAPFFDGWGRAVAHGLANADGSPSEKTLEVFETLTSGWERQPKSMGYGRGLRGMMEVHPALKVEAPADKAKARWVRSVLDTSQEVFERRWNEEALKHLDDIPSRA